MRLAGMDPGYGSRCPVERPTRRVVRNKWVPQVMEKGLNPPGACGGGLPRADQVKRNLERLSGWSKNTDTI